MKTATNINELLEQCASARLALKIDKPIDEAFATFRPKQFRVRSARRLHTFVLKFLQHYDGLQYSGITGLMEASRLIELATHADGGFERAFASIKDGTRGGLRRFLTRVVSYIKEERRQAYVRGALRIAIDPSDPEQRLRLAKELLVRRAPYFLLDAPAPEQIANRLEALVLVIAETESHLNRCLVA